MSHRFYLWACLMEFSFPDDYQDEIAMMSLSQMTDTTQPDYAAAFDETPAIEVSDVVQIDSTPEMLCVDVALADAFMFEGAVSPTVVVSDSVDSPLFLCAFEICLPCW